MNTPKQAPVPKLSDEIRARVKDKLTEELLSLHMSKIFEINDPTIIGSELTQLVADIATGQSINEQPLQYKTASLKRDSIEQALVDKKYEDLIKGLTDDHKKALIAAILGVLETSEDTVNYANKILLQERERNYDAIFQDLALEKITADDIQVDAAVLFLKEYIKNLKFRIKEMNDKGKLTDTGVNFIRKVEELELKTSKLQDTPSYDELLVIRNSLNNLVTELNIDNTDPNKTGYKDIFKRDRSLLPLLIVSAIKLLFVTSALGLAIAGIFVPVLLIPAVILVVIAAATAIFQKKIMEKRGEQPAPKPSEGLDQAVSGMELTNSIPGWIAIKSLLFDYFIPTFTDVFKYSYLLSKSAAHPAIEVGNYAANARTVLGYVSTKMYGRSGTAEGKPRASSADHDRINSTLELKSVSERPDSQQSWHSSSSFGHEPKEPSANVNAPTRNLQNLRKNEPAIKPEEPSPLSGLPRPSSRPGSSGKK